MATTVAEGFDILKSNVRITDLQEAVVSRRQQNVREVMASELNVLDSFLAGSYRRNTMIAPLAEADVDIFIVLDPEYFARDGETVLLDRARRVLRRTFTRTPEISRNGQAVTITFNDFVVDVVPSFNRKGGGYLIPNSISGSWISTDPKKHIEIWSAANKQHLGSLVPLIKMIKAWNKEHSAVFHSFHLETLVMKILEGVRISDYPSGVRYFFDHARVRVKEAIDDPAGYGGNLAEYLYNGDTMNQVVRRLETAYARAAQAERLAAESKIYQAYAMWRLIFGDYFPSYG